MSKYKVEAGKEFPVDELGVIKEKTRRISTSVDAVLRLVAGLVLAGFVIGAALIGLVDSTFDELYGLWGYVGPLALYLVGYSSGKNSRSDDDTS